VADALSTTGIAYRVDLPTNRTRHLIRDSNGPAKPLCGHGVVTWIGNLPAKRLNATDEMHDPNCRTCWRIAGPDVTSLWDECRDD
jgi:hypothetical protein